ncbi:MAG: hypothetical protein AB8U25_03635 [Rickettsiales endosymbiont of Dermacentor nuttalli]
MNIVVNIIDIIRIIQKKFELLKTGMDFTKTIVDPEEKKSAKIRGMNDRSEKALDQESIDSSIGSDLSLASDVSSASSLTTFEVSNVDNNVLSEKLVLQENISRFSRFKKFITQKIVTPVVNVIDRIRVRYNSAKQYMNENYPRTAKVIGGIAKGIDHTISIIGGKTACRAFLVISAGLLFASGVGTVPAAIMMSVAIVAVGISVAIETGRLRKVNNLKDENVLTEAYVDANEQLKKITKSNQNVEKFFKEKDVKTQEMLDIRNAAEKPKSGLLTRIQNAIPKPLRSIAKTLRDNLGEAGSYVTISALTGNVFGIITSTIYFVFGNNTSIPERLGYETLKTTLRDNIEQNAKEIKTYKNKYELQNLLKQQYVECDTREILVNSKDFNHAAKEGNQKVMHDIYKKTYAEVEKNYTIEQKPSIFKSITNYLKDMININIKGMQPDESLDHYTDRKYNHSPKIHINEKQYIGNISQDCVQVGQEESSHNISRELIDEAQKLLHPKEEHVDSAHQAAVSLKRDERRAL